MDGGANLEVKGEYRDVRGASDPPQLALRLRASVLDRQGDPVVELGKSVLLEGNIEDPNVIVQVLGVNTPDLGAGLTPQRRSAEVAKRLDEPQAYINGARVSADSKSPYGVELQIKSGEQYEPRILASEGGVAYAPLRKDEVFAVRLFNDSPHDAAVELTIDGLSVFAFSENKDYRHIVVPKGKSVLIKGWHRTNEISDLFLIAEYSKSAVAELLVSPDQIGTITATFSAAWDPKEVPPRDESSKFRDPFNAAVGRGEPVRTPYVQVRRKHGRVRDVVSVRYRKLSEYP